MKISAKINYACKAILALSLHYPNTDPLQVQVIANQQRIPIKFLIQILLHLKQFDLIKSVRGKKGGYLLNRHPKEIKLSEVIAYFDNSHLMVVDEEENSKNFHVMNDIWKEIDQVIIKKFESIDFEMICQRQRKIDETVMFDI